MYNKDFLCGYSWALCGYLMAPRGLAMTDKDRCLERVKECCAAGTLWLYIYIYIYFKMNSSTRGVFLIYRFFFNACFWRFTSSSRSKTVCSCLPFYLSSGDCFDKVVILFNSRIYVCEFSVRVKCPWQIFDPLFVSLFFFSLLFLFTKVCSVCLYVYMAAHIYACVYIFSFFFFLLFFCFCFLYYSSSP